MTKILNIKLERDELHTKLGGGLPENSLTVIEGADGGGKSVLCQRFTYGLLQNGHSVTYISTEMNTVEFLRQMGSLKYGVVNEILSEKLMFIPMFPFFGEVELDENFMDNLFKARKIYQNEIIVFDTLSSLIIQDTSRKSNFEIIDFFKRLIGMGKTIVIAINPDLIDDSLKKMLTSFADVYLRVELRSRFGVLVNFIDIVRFKRAGDRLEKEVPFRVDPGVGISIEIAG